LRNVCELVCVRVVEQSPCDVPAKASATTTAAFGGSVIALTAA
jgi:galactokinase